MVIFGLEAEGKTWSRKKERSALPGPVLSWSHRAAWLCLLHLGRLAHRIRGDRDGGEAEKSTFLLFMIICVRARILSRRLRIEAIL